MPLLYNTLNANGNKITNAVIDPLASAPGSPKTAQLWFLNTAGGDGQGRLQIKLGTRTMTIDDQYVTGVTPGTALTNSGTALAPVLNVQAASGSVPGTLSAADYTLLHTATNLATGSALVQRDSSGNVQFNMVSIANAPVNPTDAVNLQFAQSMAAGFYPKADVVCATTSALPAYVYANGTAGVGATLTASANGAFPAVDGVTLNTIGQRILVKNETAGNLPYNGIYTLTTVGTVGTPWVLTRAADFNTATANVPGTIQGGAYLFCVQGTNNAVTQWFLTNATAITVGTTGLTWGQSNASSVYTGSNGVTVSGSAISANLTGTTTLETVANALRVKSSATVGQVLLSAGTGNEAAYGAVNLASANAVTGILPKANGGFGQDVSTGVAANLFAASPNGSSGAMGFRAIAPADFPTAGLVGAGTYTKLTLDAYGRPTGSSTLAAGDIPNLDFAKITTGIVPMSQGGLGFNLTSLATLPAPQRLPVVACATSNINIASPGATLDGVAMSAGQRALLTGQSTASQNGLWVWNGAAAAMTRPADFAAASTTMAYQYMVVDVTAGTVNTGTTWYLNTAGAITIDTTSINFTQLPMNMSAASTTGQLPMASGGTGSGTAAGARANLGAAGVYPGTICL